MRTVVGVAVVHFLVQGAGADGVVCHFHSGDSSQRCEPWFVGWLVGWLVGCLFDCFFVCFVVCVCMLCFIYGANSIDAK